MSSSDISRIVIAARNVKKLYFNSWKIHIQETIDFCCSNYQIEQLYFINWDMDGEWDKATITYFTIAVINSDLKNSIKLIYLSDSDRIKMIAKKIFQEVGLLNVKI